MKIFELINPPPVEVLIECFGRCREPFILDSAQTNDGLGGWSFFGANPFAIESGSLGALAEKMRDYTVQPNDRIPFVGGAVGYIAYDYGRWIERMPDLALERRSIPDLSFGLYDGIVASEHASGRVYLVALGIRADEDVVLAELQSIIDQGPHNAESTQARMGDWEWNLSRDAYLDAVERVRAYIAGGDVYQVNLSRCARCRFDGDALGLYQALRRNNPAPYGAYLQRADFTVLSSSPEQFLVKRGAQLESRPIKGTRPRGQTTAEDMANIAALSASAKDRAELLMIVDLVRNDLGRVADFGSVEVKDLYQIERYARVIHQTARVRARLAADKDVFDTIRALFPGGSITGAPKVRAMEIIEELESTRRGVYCGSIGYLGFDGGAELNIAIRSLQLKDGYLDYQVGGGIVWDSVPEQEYLETADKGRAIVEAIEAYCRGDKISPSN